MNLVTFNDRTEILATGIITFGVDSFGILKCVILGAKTKEYYTFEAKEIMSIRAID